MQTKGTMTASTITEAAPPVPIPSSAQIDRRLGALLQEAAMLKKLRRVARQAEQAQNREAACAAN